MAPQSVQGAEYLFKDVAPADIAALDRILATLIVTLEATDEEGRSRFLEATRPEEG